MSKLLIPVIPALAIIDCLIHVTQIYAKPFHLTRDVLNHALASKNKSLAILQLNTWAPTSCVHNHFLLVWQWIRAKNANYSNVFISLAKTQEEPQSREHLISR
ncbi:unnamed protein product [Ceutorhynchus assimilis]|uniref:Secreted protein n=1 Tax=Ceutorhynchus assimilis TaxID=467358 RepID=A0A9N9MLZ1_9CUCU|nr:unnamed protein product [Ceutorhynchus assimilis]